MSKAKTEAAAEWVAIDELHEWADNPRKNDGEPVDRVAASIHRLGWGAPIVARKNGEIIAGHTRWKAAKKLGLDRVPVRYVDLDPADAKLMALADNRLNEYASWDMPKLQEIMGEFSFDDVNVAGWSQADIDKMASDMLERVPQGSVEDEWQGMPECENEDQSPYRTILVHFQDEEGVREFAALMGQKITDKTKFLNHPYQAPDETVDLAWVDSDA